MSSTKTSAAAPVAPRPTETYAAAYARLTAIAERLKATGSSASIDGLVDDLREARAAYETCRAHLAAIRAEVDSEMALTPEPQG